MKGARSKPNASYASSHASKVKSSVAGAAEAGGKMTKFKSLDDIPDALQDFEWASDEISFKEDEYDGEFQSKAQSNDYEDLSPNFQKPVSGGKQNNYLQSHPAGQKEVPTKAGTAKVPPLPYDQSRSSTKNQRAANQLSNQIPVPPSSKYFDYDNGDDNFDDDDEVYSPKSKTFSIQKVNYSAIGGSGAGRRSPEFAPPLPYEANAASDGGKGAVAEQDSIYFSKKPRPINFKPYTMKQYKMIQPKEYVQISNIKPDLNSEELVAKRANLDRIKEFSRNLQSYNRQVIGQQPKLAPASEKRDIAVSEQKFNSRRQRAIEFAKNVPKPKVATSASAARGDAQQRCTSQQRGAFKDNDESELGDNFDGGYGARPHSDSSMHMGADYAKESRIMELESQHNNRKIQMEVIRKTLGMK